MAMMSAVALVSVSCRNGGDDKPVTVTTGKEVPLSAEKLSQIGKFDLVGETFNIPVDINKDGVKNTDLLKEINICEIENELVFKSPTTYEINNSCKKEGIKDGTFEVNENNKTLIFYNQIEGKKDGTFEVNENNKTLIFYNQIEGKKDLAREGSNVSLTEKDGKYYLKYKSTERDTENITGNGVGALIEATFLFKSR